ncbi:hypothetical protein [Neobacillus sp. 19]|uniref:hypothetical protein n=1 Tax=Neobacillus sp. 19 TaxID=3394458 RepID=UPI003C2C91F6
MKTNLGHHREVVSEGDADNRETRSRISRPKCKSVKHGGGVSWRPCDYNGKPATNSNGFCSMNQPGRNSLPSDGAGYV